MHRVRAKGQSRQCHTKIKSRLVGAGVKSELRLAPQMQGALQGGTGEHRYVTATIKGCSIAGPGAWAEMPTDGGYRPPWVMHDHHLAAMVRCCVKDLSFFWVKAGEASTAEMPALLI